MFCANVIDGELFLGNNYVAGEIGHTIVCEGGRRCECGKNGCLQTYSSEYHLLKNARMLYENSPRTLLRELAASPDEITIDTVTTAYSMGDSGITAFISEALKYLGVTVSNHRDCHESRKDLPPRTVFPESGHPHGADGLHQASAHLCRQHL